MANSPKSKFGDQPEDLHEQNGRDIHEGSPHRPDEFETMNPARLKAKGRNLHKGETSLDHPAPSTGTREDFPTDPKTGGLPADHVRNAGPAEMDAPPEDWEQVDEESDESFPASDPPGNY